jgi:hypothetical protein
MIPVNEDMQFKVSLWTQTTDYIGEIDLNAVMILCFLIYHVKVIIVEQSPTPYVQNHTDDKNMCGGVGREQEK